MIASLRHSLRRVRSDEELREFAVGFREAIVRRSGGALEGHVPLDYLRAAIVRAVFDAKGVMIAGYVIGTDQPFRLISFVPADARRTLVPPEGASWDDCCEIACFWKQAGVSPTYMLARVWPQAVVDAVRTGRRFILGHNQSERLDELYLKSGRGITLYAGPSVANLPSRLFAFRTRAIWKDAVYVIAFVHMERLVSRLRRR